MNLPEDVILVNRTKIQSDIADIRFMPTSPKKAPKKPGKLRQTTADRRGWILKALNIPRPGRQWNRLIAFWVAREIVSQSSPQILQNTKTD
jgi:hypothetical protein